MSKGKGLMPVPSPPAHAALAITFFTTIGECVWFLGPSVLPRQLFPTSAEETWWAGRKTGSGLQAASWTPLVLCLHLDKVHLFWWFISEYEKEHQGKLLSLEVQRAAQFTRDLKLKKSLLLQITPCIKGEKFPKNLKAWYARRLLHLVSVNNMHILRLWKHSLFIDLIFWQTSIYVVAKTVCQKGLFFISILNLASTVTYSLTSSLGQ